MDPDMSLDEVSAIHNLEFSKKKKVLAVPDSEAYDAQIDGLVLQYLGEGGEFLSLLSMLPSSTAVKGVEALQEQLIELVGKEEEAENGNTREATAVDSSEALNDRKPDDKPQGITVITPPQVEDKVGNGEREPIISVSQTSSLNFTMDTSEHDYDTDSINEDDSGDTLEEIVGKARRKLQDVFLRRAKLSPEKQTLPQHLLVNRAQRYIRKLEDRHSQIDESIRQATRIDKVLLEVVHLENIIGDSEHMFRLRVGFLLASWGVRVRTDQQSGYGGQQDMGEATVKLFDALKRGKDLRHNSTMLRDSQEKSEAMRQWLGIVGDVMNTILLKNSMWKEDRLWNCVIPYWPAKIIYGDEARRAVITAITEKSKNQWDPTQNQDGGQDLDISSMKSKDNIQGQKDTDMGRSATREGHVNGRVQQDVENKDTNEKIAGKYLKGGILRGAAPGAVTRIGLPSKPRVPAPAWKIVSAPRKISGAIDGARRG